MTDDEMLGKAALTAARAVLFEHNEQTLVLAFAGLAKAAQVAAIGSMLRAAAAAAEKGT